ncbi:HdeD family acid-resistance protein [Haloarchaeobius sp. DFWS5]|uniref:HdeD family acid-resistance protein n=1 Tax=Haloarchaeobius sp. DFWS5 TaxID=3446114 RepID=UPI003EB69A77
MSIDDTPSDEKSTDETTEFETEETTTTTAVTMTQEELTALGLQNSWRTLMATGAILAILGLLAMIFAFFTSVALTLLFGASLVVAGFVTIAHAFSAKKWTGFVWEAILAAIYGIAGLLVLANPVLGLASLTFLLIAYFLVSGIVEIGMGIKTRGHPNWGWLIASGVLGIIVGVLLFMGLPSTAAWAVGLLFGANLLVSGISMIMLAMGTKKTVESGVAPPAAKPGAGV